MMKQVSDRWRCSSVLTLSAAVMIGVAFIIMLSCDAASAADASASPMTLDSMIDEFKASSELYGQKIYQYAMWLFWTLAFIEFAWAAIQVGVRGEMSLGALWSMVFKQMMLIGIFWWLLQKWPTLADTIVGGLGRDLPNVLDARDYSPVGILYRGVQAFAASVMAGFMGSPFGGLTVGVISGLVTFLAFSFAAAALCVYMIEWHVGVPIGVIILGLGGSSWSKSYVESYIRFLISLGLKILSVKLVLIVLVGYIDKMLIATLKSAGSAPGFLNTSMTLGGLAIVAYMLVRDVPGIASSMLSGASLQSGASNLTSAVAGAKNNITSIGNTAQTAAQTATNAGAKMYGVGKAASLSASSAYKASMAASASGGDGEGGGKLKSALRAVGSTAQAVGKGALAGAKIAGKMTALGAVNGIASWAGISKKEDPMTEMSRNVAAIAQKLGVNDAPEKNVITPGAKVNDPNIRTGGSSPNDSPKEAVDRQHGADVSRKLKDMEDAANEQDPNEQKRGDAV